MGRGFPKILAACQQAARGASAGAHRIGGCGQAAGSVAPMRGTPDVGTSRAPGWREALNRSISPEPEEDPPPLRPTPLIIGSPPAMPPRDTLAGTPAGTPAVAAASVPTAEWGSWSETAAAGTRVSARWRSWSAPVGAGAAPPPPPPPSQLRLTECLEPPAAAISARAPDCAAASAGGAGPCPIAPSHDGADWTDVSMDSTPARATDPCEHGSAP